MKILALEFSSPVRSVAVGGDVTKRGCAEESGSRETKPLALIDAALTQAKISREEIECIAVGLGPGSYAGIRIAIAIAQGWQLARGVKLLGTGSANCVAAQLHARGDRGILNVVIDAQRGELFAARYELGSAWKKISDFALLTAEEQARRVKAGELMARPDMDERAAPNAEMLASLAAQHTNFVTASQLEPIYLRKAEFVKAPLPRMI